MIIPGTIERLIDELAPAIDAALRTTLEATLAAAPAREHPAVGRLYRSLFDYLHNGGKRMHGASVVLAFEAVGGRPREAILPVAAGFQLYHHHTLVHDDVYDQDDRRRGSPTIHRAFIDWSAAVLAARGCDRQARGPDGVFTGPAERLGTVAGFIQGKVVHALAFESIGRSPFPEARRLAALRALNAHDVADGASELLDVYHEGTLIPEPDGCLAILRLKTGQLFRVGVETAGMLAEADPHQIQSLSSWIGAVSAAYQLQDDLEDLEADSEKGLGRGIGTDLRTCKPTYLLALALECCDPAGRAALEGWIREPGSRAGALQPIIEVIRRTGAIAACRRKVVALLEEGAAALRAARPALDPEAVAVLEEFGAYFVSNRYWKRPLPGPRDPLGVGPSWEAPP